MMHGQRESAETALLREKIRIKKIDRKVYVEEMESILAENRDTRNALRVGNDCLRFMTQRQSNMSVSINGRIFADRPTSERLPMMKTNLQNSIIKNDNRLFRYGKRLLKQDCIKGRRHNKTVIQTEELARVIDQEKATDEDFEERSESFLHKQAEVEDNKNRQVSAKLVHQRLSSILDQLNQSLKAYPLRIRDLEHQITSRRKELIDFKELRAGALRFLNIEQCQLDPLNQELSLLTSHFEKLIATEKTELDDRRKKNSLSKFLSERESHAFNFTEGSNIMETKIKARNKALVNSAGTLMQVMDAMLLTDVRHVVSCIVDQEEVTKLLNREKAKRLDVNRELRANLDFLKRNYDFLKFNGVKHARYSRAQKDSLHREEEARRKFEGLEKSLSTQDNLMSSIRHGLHSLFNKLRPIKLNDDENLFKNELIPDIENFTTKLKKMLDLIERRTVHVGNVKPLMLSVFNQKRVPADACRVELQPQNNRDNMSGFDTFESIQPGYISREFLKNRSEEEAAPKKKKKKED